MFLRWGDATVDAAKKDNHQAHEHRERRRARTRQAQPERREETVIDTHPNTDPHTLSRIAHRFGQPYRDLTCDTRDNLELRIARRGGWTFKEAQQVSFGDEETRIAEELLKGGWQGSLAELAAVTQHKPGTANGNLERRQ